MPEARGGKPSSRKNRAARGDRKRQYLDVARQLFAEFGYSSVGFEQIAENAGVTRAVLVRTFADKPALLRAIGDDWLQAVFPKQETAEDLPFVAVSHLLAFSERLLASLRHDQPTARIILTGLTEPALEEESTIVRGILQTAIERLTPVIHEGQQAGVIRRSLDPLHTATDWMRFLLGAALLPEPELKEGDLPTLLIETLLHGVLKTDV